jgi:DNA-binding IclR family transcriptional regulator
MGVHCTGLGKALGACLSRPELEALLQAHPLLRHNDNTISSRRKLFQQLELVAKLGYALDNEEEEVGCRCIGVPVPHPDGGVPTAISVAGTSAQLNEQNLPTLIGETMRVGRELAAALWASEQKRSA